MTFKDLEIAAMQLPPAARSKLAASLLWTLDESDSTETERMWVEEAERRYRAYRSGNKNVTPAKKAIAEARSAIRP
jgi:hypothetical protein